MHGLNWRKGENLFFADYTTVYLENSRGIIEKSLDLIRKCIKSN